ncbi:MAG TPA: hypothetical protein VFI94_13700 [Pseudolabrys sp.]|nr:hypothetical protein [Pseudolabrys sp.]
MPTPTQLDEIKDVAELIAEPEAAKPRKAGAAKGKAGANAGSNAKSKSNRKNEPKDKPKDKPKNDPKSIAESTKPKAVAAKAKEPKLQSSKRKGKGR